MLLVISASEPARNLIRSIRIDGQLIGMAVYADEGASRGRSSRSPRNFPLTCLGRGLAGSMPPPGRYH